MQYLWDLEEEGKVCLITPALRFKKSALVSPRLFIFAQFV
jgi:hypothetical protein